MHIRRRFVRFFTTRWYAPTGSYIWDARTAVSKRGRENDRRRYANRVYRVRTIGTQYYCSRTSLWPDHEGCFGNVWKPPFRSNRNRSTNGRKIHRHTVSTRRNLQSNDVIIFPYVWIAIRFISERHRGGRWVDIVEKHPSGRALRFAVNGPYASCYSCSRLSVDR